MSASPAHEHSRVILVRHGQTVANRDGLVLGRSDYPLTDHGRATARTLASHLVSQPVAKVVASALGRARATGEILAAALHCSLETTELLVELSCGEWEGRKRLEVLRDERHIRAHWNDRPPGGESYAQAEERIQPLITELNRRCDETVALVGHGGINRAFIKGWLDLDEQVALRITCPHEAAYLLAPLPPASEGNGPPSGSSHASAAPGPHTHTRVRIKWADGSEQTGLLLS